MAETKRMRADEVVGYLLEGEGLDFMREALGHVRKDQQGMVSRVGLAV